MKAQPLHLMYKFCATTNILCTNFNVFNNPSMFLYNFVHIQQLPEDYQDRLKHFRVMTNCTY